MTSLSVSFVSCLFNVVSKCCFLPNASCLLPLSLILEKMKCWHLNQIMSSVFIPFISFIERNHSFKAHQSSTSLIACEVILVKSSMWGSPRMQLSGVSSRPSPALETALGEYGRASLCSMNAHLCYVPFLPLGIHLARPNAHPSS